MRTLIGILLGSCLAAISQGVGAQGNEGIGEEGLTLAKAPPAIRGWVKVLSTQQCSSSALGALRTTRGVAESGAQGDLVWGYTAGAVVVIRCLQYKDGPTLAAFAVADKSSASADRLLRAVHDALGRASPVSSLWREGQVRGWPSWGMRSFNTSGAALKRCSDAAAAMLGRSSQESPAPWATVVRGQLGSSSVSISCLAVKGNPSHVEIVAASWERDAAKRAAERLEAELRRRLG